MLGFLPPVLRGVIAMLLLLINVVFWCSLLFVVALPKLLLPIPPLRRVFDRVLNGIANAWVACNSGWIRLVLPTRWDVQGRDGISTGGWYMVICNHQSWADILVLQHVLGGRIPLLKFFLKRQLIYVPIMGLAWWALDFPFMARHSRRELEKRPELRLKDRETTRRACEKFALVPTSVMTFVEGTRFTQAKHDRQASPYAHLLKPKAGALALSLEAMGERFRSLLDVTIVYPEGTPTFWEFACGRAPRIIVRVQQREIPLALCQGDYGGDSAFRASFHTWLEQLWQEKDVLIGELKASPRPAR